MSKEGVIINDYGSDGMYEVEFFNDDNTTIKVTRVFKGDLEKRNMNEGFNPMIGIENFLNNPIMIALATSWLVSGRFSPSNLKANTKEIISDFLEYCNSMGYAIDQEVLNSRFDELIQNVKKIIKL